MTYLYGGPVPRSIQKSLHVKQTGVYDDATWDAVKAYYEVAGIVGSGKKISEPTAKAILKIKEVRKTEEPVEVVEEEVSEEE